MPPPFHAALPLVVTLAALGACNPSSQHTTIAPAEPDETPAVDETPASPAPAAPARAGADLIPRTTLFRQDHARVRISADGTQIGWRATAGGSANLWVAPVDDPTSARQITQETGRMIGWWDWFQSSSQVLYTLDRTGGENTHVYLASLLDPDGAETRDLTPYDGVRSTVVRTTSLDPDHIVVSMNDRDATVQDLYRLDVTTGQRTLLAQNEGDFSAWVVDDHLRVAGARRANADGSLDVLTYDRKLRAYKPLFHVPFEDTLGVEPVGNDGSVTFLKDSRGRNTSALVAFDAVTGTSEVLADDPRADVGGVLMHRRPLAVSFTYDRTRWQVLDPSATADFDYLATLSPGDLSIDARSSDDKHWIVSFRESDRPRVYYHYERAAGAAGTATPLFSESAALLSRALPSTQPVAIRARDGKQLVSYLTLPLDVDPTASGTPTHPLPMVLWVHSGPAERDGWGFDDNTQWLANRGYAVLKVNFRGSTGFGKGFLNAGNREYGAAMQTDLADAVTWAVDHGVADPTRVAIVGGSYGGYASLVGLATTPDLFACGVDIWGAPDLVARLSTPPYNLPAGRWETPRVGDPTTAEGRRALLARSPITHVSALRKPLLVFQGARDARVVKAQSDRLVQGMTSLGLPVTYVVFPDEGHGLSRPENVVGMSAVIELFLAKCLGGEAEPPGADVAASSMMVPAGAEHIEGLQAALSTPR